MELHSYAGPTLEEDFEAPRVGEPEPDSEGPAVWDGRIKGPKKQWR